MAGAAIPANERIPGSASAEGQESSGGLPASDCAERLGLVPVFARNVPAVGSRLKCPEEAGESTRGVPGGSATTPRKRSQDAVVHGVGSEDRRAVETEGRER